MIPLMRIMAFSIALAACAAPAHAAERRYAISDFDRVQVEGPYDVTLATGGGSQARATGTQAALDRVSVSVEGRLLRIRPNRSAWGGYPGESSGPVRITLSTRDIQSATVLGPGSLAIDRVRGLKVELSVSGSGSLAVASIDADRLVAGLVGSGAVTLGGRAKHARLAAEGSGDIDAAALRAEDAEIVSGTAGSLTVAAARTAKVTAHGRGSVVVTGAPSCTVAGLSAGLVRCGK